MARKMPALLLNVQNSEYHVPNSEQKKLLNSEWFLEPDRSCEIFGSSIDDAELCLQLVSKSRL
jgi:hypothetical protein